MQTFGESWPPSVTCHAWRLKIILSNTPVCDGILLQGIQATWWSDFQLLLWHQTDTRGYCWVNVYHVPEEWPHSVFEITWQGRHSHSNFPLEGAPPPEVEWLFLDFTERSGFKYRCYWLKPKLWPLNCAFKKPLAMKSEVNQIAILVITRIMRAVTLSLQPEPSNMLCFTHNVSPIRYLLLSLF